LPPENLTDSATAAGEDPVHHRLVVAPVRLGDQRIGAPDDGHQSAVDGRRGLKRRCRNTLQQSEFEPRPPLRGHHGGAADGGPAPRHLPLHEQHRVGPPGTVQDAAQHRGGEVERQVADEHMRVAWQPVAQEVGGDDAGGGRRSGGEPRRPPGIDLDGGERPPERLQRQGESAAAGTDLEDRPVGAGHGVDDPPDDMAVAQEVLAGLMPAVMRG
jgi:hypothetical protein